MKILVTGGAGYIGSTICSALEDARHVPIILDSLVTGRKEFTRGRIFYQADISNREAVEKIFREHKEIKATIHCAALIVIPESVADPYKYYRENVGKSLEFFNILHELDYPRLVFSSSASVYDTVPGFMVTEESPLNPTSPYAHTKMMMELVLKDFCTSYDMRGIALRYFNPIGADPQMRSGLHVKEPSHAIAKLVEVQLGRQKQFVITGTDYPTRDGTGIRDYIHVWDLARAHVKAVEDFEGVFQRAGEPAEHYQVINLGTGRGVTVRELVNAFEKVIGQPINKVEGPRRPGDSAGSFTNANKALELLKWKAEMTIEQAISDALKWGAIKDQRLKY